ncbi:MAG: hypothetical protein QG602_944 [Verrucomicrobiota bacterium]|nr:hypothetical protein [Verrucomicrobiota bacterium]
MNRRLRFIKKRLRDMPVELAFAEGKRTNLPTDIRQPTPLILAAARIAAEGIAKPIAHLDPRKRKVEAGDMVELIGHFQAMVSYMSCPSPAMREQEMELPEMTALREPVAKKTLKGFQRCIARIIRRTSRKAAVPPLEYLQEQQARYAKGLGSFARGDDVMALNHASTRICYVLWMFWEEIAAPVTAPSLHLWLRKNLGESVSDKSVEAILTRVRKEARPTTLKLTSDV